jgi:hypothetical protein
VSDFVFDQIAENAIQQTPVSFDDNVVFHFNDQLVLAFVHSWLVEIHQLSHGSGEINRGAFQAKCTGLSLRNIKCGVQGTQQSIEAFDCIPD